MHSTVVVSWWVAAVAGLLSLAQLLLCCCSDCRVHRCRDAKRCSLAAWAAEPVERVSIPVTWTSMTSQRAPAAQCATWFWVSYDAELRSFNVVALKLLPRLVVVSSRRQRQLDVVVVVITMCASTTRAGRTGRGGRAPLFAAGSCRTALRCYRLAAGPCSAACRRLAVATSWLLDDTVRDGDGWCASCLGTARCWRRRQRMSQGFGGGVESWRITVL